MKLKNFKVECIIDDINILTVTVGDEARRYAFTGVYETEEEELEDIFTEANLMLSLMLKEKSLQK